MLLVQSSLYNFIPTKPIALKSVKLCISTLTGIVLYCIVLYCGRVPAANAPGCTAAEGLLYKP